MSIIKVDTIKDETGANTLVTQSGSNFAWGAGVPAGTMVYLKNVTKTGTSGAVYRPTAFYPVATSDFASKTIYMSITSSEHSPYTKLLINVSCNFRIDKNTHTVIDVKLIRWEGTGNVSSDTALLQRMLGSASTNTDEEVYLDFSGGVVDDISSLGDVQINYIIQYRVHSENSANADNIYFGSATYDKQHINAFGII